MINVIIVNNEPPVLKILEAYIQKIPRLNLIAKCENVVKAFEALNAYQLDLMFLNVQMPRITGIDFLKTLANPPKVIFTTDSSGQVMDDHELNIVGHLLKPISFEDFTQVVDKVIIVFKVDKKDESHSEGDQQGDKIDFMFVKTGKKLVKVRFEDIFYVEGLKDYVILHTPGGRVVTLQTMKSIQQKLPDNSFVRIHRSYIVNQRHIDALDRTSVSVNKINLPLSRYYKDKFFELINKNRL